MNVALDQLTLLQTKQERIRNMCIIAHVDHGKTTLSDNLIASNGLIHPKMAGELRYLDSREDEQIRGITMKSSSIALLHVPGAATRPGGAKSVSPEERSEKGFLVNLIDSPGHVDFCSEVSTAVRLSDGALVVVDAVEGVCIQTHAVLRQAFQERVEPTLFVNKVDRLILELRLSPQEAYDRLRRIVSDVNLVWSQLHSEQYMREADAFLATSHREVGDGAEGVEGQAEELDAAGPAGDENEELQFRPEIGNVAFGCAWDGWAFRLAQFASMYAAKLGCSSQALVRGLWGDWYFYPKTKKILGKKAALAQAGGKLKPLFVQFILEPLWRAYSACDAGSDVPAILGPIVRTMGLDVADSVLAHPEPRQAAKAVLRAWLPLSEAVLGMAADCMPSPPQAAPKRLTRLLGREALRLPRDAALSEDRRAAAARLIDAVSRSSASEGDPLVVYVSKMIAVPAAALPRRPGEPPASNPLEERFLAFGRVYSGVLHEGQRVHVLSAKYDPRQPEAPQHRQSAAASTLYLMMGRALERIGSVGAGNVVAIGGLDAAILKSATLSTSAVCPPFTPLQFQSAAIVRVALEPARPSDMHRLEEGLRLLNKADPFVEISMLDTGEYVLGAAGEVHLETCIKDLRERLARIELQVSPPLVAYRESVAVLEEMEEVSTGVAGSKVGIGGAMKSRWVVGATPNGRCVLRVRANGIPARIASLLHDHPDDVQAALRGELGHGGGAGTSGAGESDGLAHKLRLELKECGPEVPHMFRLAWAMGPKGNGPNLLLAGNLRRGGTEAVLHGAERSVSDKTLKPAEKPITLQEALASAGMSTLTALAGGETPRLRRIPLKIGKPEVQQKLGLSDIEPGRGGAAAPTEAADGALGLIDRHPDADSESVAATEFSEGASTSHGAAGAADAVQYEDVRAFNQARAAVESGVLAGFQLATASGPLCDEPLWGVAFEVVAELRENEDNRASPAAWLDDTVFGPFSGQVIALARDLFRRAVVEASPRLVEAMFLCEATTSAEALAGTYAALNRRRSRILSEDMREGSDLFTIHCYLPVEASFGFADDIRRRSSGAAAAQLMLSHWERLSDYDPFFVPRTEEEREEFGEDGQGQGAPNTAKRLMNSVRRRKGLPVEEKIVQSATKQRTLAKKV